MKKNIFLPMTFISILPVLHAQVQPAIDSTGRLLTELNKQIDNYVVMKNIAALDSLYADDFVFTHGTGLVDNESSWLKNVAVNGSQFLSRRHDPVTVEMHPGFALLKGRLDVDRKDENGQHRYSLRYIRVYARWNNRWQLASHSTTQEIHL